MEKGGKGRGIFDDEWKRVKKEIFGNLQKRKRE